MQTDRGHKLQIEAAQIHKFCAYRGDHVTPWLVAQIGGLARVGQEQDESRTVILSLGGCPSGSPNICVR